MRNLGAEWDYYQSNPEIPWVYQKRVVINNEVYNEDEIFSFSKKGGLIGSDFNIGMCVSAKFDVMVKQKPGIVVPRNAEIVLQIRIVEVEYNTPGASVIDSTPWFDFGTYYIDSRTETDNKISFECYDSMMFAESEMLYLENYPMPAIQAVNHICSEIGIELDERSPILNSVNVYRPLKMTKRQVLSNIASAHGGNFYITDENKLRLVLPVNGTPLDHSTRSNSQLITKSGKKTFDKLYVIYNDEGDFHEVGTGDISLEITNHFIPSYTEAAHIFGVINDYEYLAYIAKSVDLNPALELGDSIEVDGEQANVWNVSWDSRLFADISAPTEGDTSREFGFRGTYSDTSMRRAAIENERYAHMVFTLEEFDVKLSEFSVEDEYAREQIAQLTMDVAGFSVTLQQNYYTKSETGTLVNNTANALRAELTLTATQFNVFLQNNAGYTSLTQTANKVNWIVQSGTSASNFTLTPRAIDLVASTINLTGFVTFTNLSAAGQTAINGGNITAGTINADTVDILNLKVNNIRYGTYPVITCSGAYSTPKIDFGESSGSYPMRANTMNLFASTVNIGDPNTTNYSYRTTINGGSIHIECAQSQGSVTLGYNTQYRGGNWVSFDTYYNAFFPERHNAIDLGLSGSYWRDIYLSGYLYLGIASSRIGFFGRTPRTRLARPTGGAATVSTVIADLVDYGLYS